jgi:hypothetical protein
MGLDIQILSVPRAVAVKATDVRLGSRYDKNPRWQHVAHERNNWDLHSLLAALYAERGGTQDEFDDTTVRLYKRDLELFLQTFEGTLAPAISPSTAAQVIERMKKGRVVYAESSF